MTTLTTTTPVDTALTDTPPKADQDTPSWCKNADISENAAVTKILAGLPTQQLQEKGITIHSGGIASHIFTVKKGDVSVQFCLSAVDPILMASLPSLDARDKSDKRTKQLLGTDLFKKEVSQKRMWQTLTGSNSVTIKNPDSEIVLQVIDAVLG